MHRFQSLVLGATFLFASFASAEPTDNFVHEKAFLLDYLSANHIVNDVSSVKTLIDRGIMDSRAVKEAVARIMDNANMTELAAVLISNGAVLDSKVERLKTLLNDIRYSYLQNLTRLLDTKISSDTDSVGRDAFTRVHAIVTDREREVSELVEQARRRADNEKKYRGRQ